jgi:hypothetical protein
MHEVDGVHFTLHENSTDEDIAGFQSFQRLAGAHEGSFRLYLHPGVSGSIILVPGVWSRVEVKPWLPEGECPLPQDEELFVLDPEVI